MGADVQRLPGGKGANQASAAARLGARVSMIASVGDDDSGAWLLSHLHKHGIDVSSVRRSGRPTGTAFITVDQNGENQIVVASSANADLDVSSVGFDEFDVVLAQMEISQLVIEEAAKRSRSFILNVAPARPVTLETLKRCAVVVANEVESSSLDLDVLEHCVITLGGRGARLLRFGREVARAEAAVIVPVDTVGAGDVFCAAYALQFALGVPANDALRFAVAAGSLATLGLGAQGSLPTTEEVEQWLERA